MAPKDESELRDMLFTAINYKGGPIAIRYPRGSALGIELKDHFDLIEIGKGEIIKDGKDVVFLSIGSMTNYALKASEKLDIEGISAEVVNMRFAKPIDTDIIDSIVKRHNKIITLEENTISGGFGSGILEYMAEKGYKNDVLRFGLPDNFVEHGTQAELHHILGIDPDGIVEKTKLFYENKVINHEVIH